MRQFDGISYENGPPFNKRQPLTRVRADVQ